MYSRVMRLFCTILFLLAFTCSAHAATGEHCFQVDKGIQSGWQPDPYLSDLPSPLRSESSRAHNTNLIIPAKFPAPVGVFRYTEAEQSVWEKAKMIRVTLYVPREAGPYPSAALVASHPLWGWFQTQPTRLLKTGEWNTIYWSLDGDCADWISTDGKIAWNDDLRSQLDRIGLRIYADPTTQTLPVNADLSDEFTKPEFRLAEFALTGLNDPQPPLEIQKFEMTSQQALQGKRTEFSFRLSRGYSNPFDPENIAVDASFTSPEGKTMRMPAFYSQDFTRSRLADESEHCEPVGRANWKLRFNAPTPGNWQYRITARDNQGGVFEGTTQTLAVAPSAFRGFLRVDPKDNRYFSFTNGEFFYPTGLIVRSPSDTRKLCASVDTPDEEKNGTYAYDKYFKSMAASGINFSRVWMSAWWTALEWTHGYRSDYAGIGRYSLLNAWRMDYVLDLADSLGIYVDVTLHNHGQFRASEFDAEWYDNPYYLGQGGVVEQPQDFWTSPEAKKIVKKRLRYIVARWGSNSNIAWWELCNEVDLSAQYSSPNIRAWHEEMARYIKSIDPAQHIISTHFTSGRCDPSVQNLPEIEVAQSTAYESDMPGRLIKLYTDHAIFPKPVYNNEFGVGASHEEIMHNLHGGLWASTVMPFCGTALFWWWPYVQEKDQYYQYVNIIRFRADEDLRGKNYQPVRAIVPAQENLPAETRVLEAMGMQSETSARLWIYDPRIYRVGKGNQTVRPIIRAIPEARVLVDGLKPGKYHVVFWDTWKGEPLKNAGGVVEAKGDTLEISTPGFERDIACKIDCITQ
ncbi:TPA: hypothetical protein DDW35_06885 [Candidatus Sumerlaeota bacterium]|nr:hypothetical protein [Candidatus Sumerlaeota bacterium]